MIWGKTIALTIQTFVGKLMSLLFNTLSRFVIAFLPRSKCLLISWLQSLSTGILEPKKIKAYIHSYMLTHTPYTHSRLCAIFSHTPYELTPILTYSHTLILTHKDSYTLTYIPCTGTHNMFTLPLHTYSHTDTLTPPHCHMHPPTHPKVQKFVQNLSPPLQDLKHLPAPAR